MANLKQLIKDYRYEICNGIAWVAIYKDGRSWEAKAFYLESGSYEYGYNFSGQDYAAMMAIAGVDHKAVCVNGYHTAEYYDDEEVDWRLGKLPINEIEDKILYFYEARLKLLKGDFLDCFVIPPEVRVEEEVVKLFNISYMRNSVPQTVLVEAGSANEAGRYFMSQKPDATFYGIHEATADDMRPGKPVMTVPADFLKNNEAVLKQYGLDKPSDESFHYQMLSRLKSDCEYYLGNGNRYAGHLWVVGNVQGHIELMKALWNSVPADGKPEWLLYEQILVYEKEMVEPLKEQSDSARKYVDKNGMEIKAGMSLRMEDGSVEKVYATDDGYGNPDLGINASNEAFLERHPEWEREYYSLSGLDLRQAEIYEPEQTKNVASIIHEATVKADEANGRVASKNNIDFEKG